MLANPSDLTPGNLGIPFPVTAGSNGLWQCKWSAAVASRKLWRNPVGTISVHRWTQRTVISVTKEYLNQVNNSSSKSFFFKAHSQRPVSLPRPSAKVGADRYTDSFEEVSWFFSIKILYHATNKENSENSAPQLPDGILLTPPPLFCCCLKVFFHVFASSIIGKK